MTDVYTGLLLSSLPWWLAAPLVQIVILVFGMALDETYVNRATVFTGAVAVSVHTFVAGEAGLLVGLYLDIGLIIGAYGVYAYIVDAYVENWFRVVAYFLYSPLSVFFVILTAGPTIAGVEILFVPALVLSGYLNLQLMALLEPNDPYYFGPESQEVFDAVVEEAPDDGPTDESAQGEEGADATHTREDEGLDSGEFEEPDVSMGDTGGGRPPVDATPTGAESTERGILPEFMRRL